MIKSYFKIAVRSLWKHKLFSFINIFGLAAGIMVCILALLDFKKAFEYDRFHPLPDRTYRIITDMTGREQNNKEAYASTPYPVAAALQQQYGFVEQAVHVVPQRQVSYEGAGKTLTAPTYFTEPAFFKLFGFKLTAGAFDDAPYTAAITTATAERFFGTADAVGKTLHHKDWGDFLVTGIVGVSTEKSHLSFDVLLSSATIPALEKNAAINIETNNPISPWTTYTYILVKKGVHKRQLDAAVDKLGEQLTASIGKQSNYKSIGFRTQALGSINPSREDLYNFAGGTTYGKLLVEMGIGLVTLFLAGFNYVNLTLARSLTRSREIGVRKVIGASRRQIFNQLIVESVLIAFLALLLALTMLQLFSPIPMIQEALKDTDWDFTFWAILISFTLVAGLLAGTIPAKILSAFKPAMVIKGQKVLTVMRGLTARKVLVVAQFTISLVGIIFMLVSWQQQSFMANGDYGFQTAHILNIDLYGTDASRLRNEIKKIPGVEAITGASFTLGMNGGGLEKIFNLDKQVFTQAETLGADDQFISIMELPLVAGANLQPAKDSDLIKTVLINEQAVARLHFNNSQEAVNQLLTLSDSSQVRIAGVIKDFHSMSMFFQIYPMIIRYDPTSFTTMHVKTNPGVDADKTKAAIAAVWKQLNPHQAFSADWFDKALHDRHTHTGDQLMLALLCGMVLSIACLGLLGMVTFSSETRTMEVGVRKIMGAGVWQLLVLLSKDFIWLLLIAGLIAVPLGYVAGQFFLYNFTYHVTIGMGTLMAGFFAMLVVGGVTVFWQTYRIATHNPVKSLRVE